MSAKIELHYCSNLHHLSDHFLKSYLPALANPEQMVYLVNDQPRARQLADDWYLNQSGSVFSHSPFISYSNWLTTLADQLNLIPPYLNFAERVLLLQTVLNNIGSSLRYFSFQNAGFPPDLMSKMVLLIDKIRLNEADHEILQKNDAALVLHATDELQRDFRRIFSAYVDTLQNRYVDEAGLLKQLMTQLGTTFLNQFYPRLKDVIYEDISHFQHLHLRFFEHLRNQGLNVYFLLPHGQNQEIYFHKSSLFHRLRHLVNHMEKYHGVDKLSNSLFQIKALKFNFADKFHILPAANRLEEVENLAAKIKELVVDQGCPFSDIGVTSPQLPAYSSLLEMVFRRFKIPYSFLEGKTLEQMFVIQNLKWLLELVKDKYPRQILHKILQSPLFTYRERISDLAILESVPFWRVKSGKNEILHFLTKQIQQQESEWPSETTDQQLQSPFIEIKNVVEEIFLEVRFFEKPQTASAIYQYFYSFIFKHKFLEKFVNRSPNDYSEWTRENHHALIRFLEVLQRWKEMEMKSHPNAKYTVDQLWEIFKTLTRLFTPLVRRPSRIGVQIIPFHRLNSQKFKAFFIVGMEEKVFPANPSLNITSPHNLPDNLKRFAFEDQSSQEKEVFLHLLQFPAEWIQFSFSRFHKDKPVLPSPFLRELQRISEHSLEIKSNLKLYTPAAVLEKVLANQPDLTKDHQLPEFMVDILSNESYADFRRLSRVALVRQQLTFPTEWEGILSSDPAAAGWINRESRIASFSPTHLETYARCPMMYFFNRLLHLQPYEELDEFVRPLDRGLILHHILYRFYCQIEPPQRSLSTLIGIAQEELEKFKIADSLLWEVEKSNLLGSDDQTGLLPAFWEYEQQISQNYKTVPRHYEISLGRTIHQGEGIDPLSTPHPYIFHKNRDPYYFSGKIDRVEIAENGALLVVDYKSGTAPNLAEIWKGEKLQLPMYLRMAYDLLKNNYSNLHMAGAAFYALKDENNIEKKLVFAHSQVDEISSASLKTVAFPHDKYQLNGQPLTLEQFIEYIFDFAIHYIHQIREGQFPHTTDQSKCRKHNKDGCDYLPLCRLNWYKSDFLKRRQESDSLQ